MRKFLEIESCSQTEGKEKESFSRLTIASRQDFKGSEPKEHVPFRRNSSEYFATSQKAKSPKPDRFAKIVYIVDTTRAKEPFSCCEAWKEDEGANSNQKHLFGDFPQRGTGSERKE